MFKMKPHQVVYSNVIATACNNNVACIKFVELSCKLLLEV